MEEFKFKYKYVNDQGQPEGLFSKTAVLTPEMLLLDVERVSTIDIIAADGHQHNVVVAWQTPNRAKGHVAFRVTRGGVKNVVRRINSYCSHQKAKRRYSQLQEDGKADQYRDWHCPHCSSVIDLSGREQSPQIWCPYCDILVTQSSDAPRDEATYHTCDQCGLYAQPKTFTTLYIYFLLVVWGFQYETRRMCNVCMRREAWKMLAFNFLFVVGLVPSIVQLMRSYFGGSKLSGAFRELDSANAAVHKHNYPAASELYFRILEKQPSQAGVHYNHGLALLEGGDIEHAVEAFSASLSACVNYEPSYVALERILSNTGDEARLDRIRQRYDGIDYVPSE